MRRHLKTFSLFLLLGLIATIAVCMILAATVNVSTGVTRIATRGDWTVTVASAPDPFFPAAVRVVSESSPLPRTASWNPLQATAAPNTPNPGDYATAWAPATSTGQPEWLLLTYDHPVVPAFVDVHETYHPGALTRVTLVRDDGTEIEAWRGTDPTPPSAGKGISHIPMKVQAGPTPAVQMIKLYLGIPGLSGWNEIDAVGLIDANGTTQWAADASASSWYGQGSYASQGAPGVSPDSLLPSWTRLTAPKHRIGPRPAQHEAHGADARGWPFLALWAPFDPDAIAGKSRWTPYAGGSSMPAAAVYPWRPIWSGLLLNTALYALVLWLLWSLLTKPRRFLIELSRLKRGCCVSCGYDLGYDFPRGCPECGWRRPTQNSPQQQNVSSFYEDPLLGKRKR